MRKYYERIAKERSHLGLIVETLPKTFDAAWVRDRNEKPGILALAMRETKNVNGESDFQVRSFVCHFAFSAVSLKQRYFSREYHSSYRGLGSMR